MQTGKQTQHGRTLPGTIPILLLCSAGLILASAVGGMRASAPAPQTKKWADQMPEGDGKKLVVARCHNCHTLETTITAHHDRKEWDATIQRMIDLGTYLTDDDRKLVVDYLVVNYPPKAADAAAPPTPPRPLR
jgi:hypothetical protein